MDKAHEQLLLELEAFETGVWDGLVRGDELADARALHDDFLGVYPDGFATKTDHIQQLNGGPTIRKFKLTDCRVLTLGHEHAVFSYKADFVRNNKETSETMYVSSIWQRTDGSWINIFSQDTPAIE